MCIRDRIKEYLMCDEIAEDFYAHYMMTREYKKHCPIAVSYTHLDVYKRQEDAYHFSKVFKKYYGISPLYYKGRAKI